MAGRGGKTSSFTKEQLQAMGVGAKEINPSVQLPPPLFPPLVCKPRHPDDTMERQYKIMWKDDFVIYLKDSPYFMADKGSKTDRQDIQNMQKAKEKPNFCWNLMPPELRPNFKRNIPSQNQSSASKPNVAKRSKAGTSVEEKLKILEDKEKQGPLEPKDIKKDLVDEEEQVEDTLEDDEMDDDYGNSYFDNGESFNEEDDNLDDGPVY